MSDERSTDPLVDLSPDHSAELSASLRKLAESQQSSPPLAGSAVRRRAARRRRRRVAVTAGAGVTVLAAAFAVALPLQDSDKPQPPAASATTPAPTTSIPATPHPAAGTIDVAQRTLTIGERVLPISVTNLPVPLTDNDTLTVSALYESERTFVSGQQRDGDGYGVEAHFVVELRGPEGERLHIGSEIASPTGARGTETTSDGWIGLDATAGRWLYSAVRVGDRVEVAAQSHAPRLSESRLTPRGEPPRD